VLVEPRLEIRVGARHQGEQRELDDDALVERGGLEEGDELPGGEAVEAGEGGACPREHLGREHVRPLVAQDLLQALRQQLVRRHVVDLPDHPVEVVLLGVLGGEVQGDVRREGPVEQARGKAVVLRDGQPVPDRVAGRRLALRVLPEVAQQVALHLRRRAKPREAARQLLAHLRLPSERIPRAEPAQPLLPRALVQHLVQLVPARDPHVFHGKPPARL